MTLTEYAREQARAAQATHGPAPDHIVAAVGRALLTGGGDPDVEPVLDVAGRRRGLVDVAH